MTARPQGRRKTHRAAQDRERRFAVLWHLAWTAAVAAAAGMLFWQGGLAPGVELYALAVGAAAALCGAALAAAGGRAARTAAILVWTLAGAAAAQMTGGAAGPLAVWCLAPLAAAAAFGGADILAMGAAAAVAAAAVAATGGLLVPLPEPEPWARSWLSLLAMATVALGLGAGMAALQGRVRREVEARRAAERRLRALLDDQPVTLLGLDLAGRVEEMFGPSPGDLDLSGLPGGVLSELAATEDRPALEAALREAADGGLGDAAFRVAGRPETWLALTARRTGSRLAVALRDAAAQHAREAALEQARAAAEEQNAGKSRFLANMSHELRTPLNAIMGFSDIMRQRLFGPVADRYAEYAQLIHESGSHLLELINDVLDMSKIEAERFELAKESFDAREAVYAVLRLMRGQADRAGVNLRAVLPREPLEADADRRAIKQIAINLVSNALRFTPRGGTVTVHLEGHDDCLQLAVADTGVGISPEDVARLGRPFEQAGDAGQRAAGSGLGLSLVRAFAKLHGGDMAIESEVAKGTTVTVRMPILLPPVGDAGRATVAGT